MNVKEQFGEIDIYLFDQILKNRFAPNSKILDAGCSGGRNMVWFLRNDFEVFGIDQNEINIQHVAIQVFHRSRSIFLPNYSPVLIANATQWGSEDCHLATTLGTCN